MTDGIPGDEIESREDAKRPVERLIMRLRAALDEFPVINDDPRQLLRDAALALDNMIWRPIETAPTDGTSVLVFLPGSRYVRHKITSGYWDDHQKCRCWIAAGYMQKDNPPTHWMPYPDAPDGCA